jgi:hypothetical protein
MLQEVVEFETEWKGLGDSKLGSYQSFGFDPLTTTLVSTSSGPGEGIGESTISTFRPGCTIASFIFVSVLFLFVALLDVQGLKGWDDVYIRTRPILGHHERRSWYY